MKIILDKKHTLYSDSLNIWITRKTIPTKADGTKGAEREDVITGYHQDLDRMLESLRLKKIRGCDTSKVEEMNKNIHVSDKEIIKFSKEISKFVMECRKGEKE